jgi:hypothetical protein
MSYRSDAERIGNATDADDTNAPAIETTAVKRCFLTTDTGTTKTDLTPFPTSFPLRYNLTCAPFGAVIAIRKFLPTRVIFLITTAETATERNDEGAAD